MLFSLIMQTFKLHSYRSSCFKYGETGKGVLSAAFLCTSALPLYLMVIIFPLKPIFVKMIKKSPYS